MNFKIYSNTQHISLKKIFPSILFGLVSFQKKNFTIKEKDFSLLEKFYQKLSQQSPIETKTLSIFQSLQKAIVFFQTLPFSQDEINIHINILKPFHKKFHKFFIIQPSLRKSFSHSLGGIDLHQKTLFLDDHMFSKTYHQFQEQKIPLETLSQLILFHELGHYSEHYQISHSNSTYHQFLNSLKHISFLAQKTSTSFLFSDIAKKNKHCEPVCVSFLSNLKKLQEEIFADVFAFISLKIFQEENQIYEPQVFLNYLSTIAQYRQKTFEISKRELDFEAEHIQSSFYESIHHFTTLGIYELTNYLTNHRVEKKDLLHVAEFITQQSFEKILRFLLEEDYHLQKQMNTFFIAHQQDFSKFQENLQVQKKADSFSSQFFQQFLNFILEQKPSISNISSQKKFFQ
jgi:hypothetical protein